MKAERIGHGLPARMDYKKIDHPVEVLLSPAHDLVLHNCLADVLSKSSKAKVTGAIGTDRIDITFTKTQKSLDFKGKWGEIDTSGKMFPRGGEVAISDNIGSTGETAMMKSRVDGMTSVGYSGDYYVEQELHFFDLKHPFNEAKITSRIGDFKAEQKSTQKNEEIEFSGYVLDDKGYVVTSLSRTVRPLPGGGYEVRGHSYGAPILEYITPG